MASFHCGSALNAWQHRVGIRPHSTGFGSLPGAITPAARFPKKNPQIFRSLSQKQIHCRRTFLIFSRFFAGTVSLCARTGSEKRRRRGRLVKSPGRFGNWSPWGVASDRIEDAMGKCSADPMGGYARSEMDYLLTASGSMGRSELGPLPLGSTAGKEVAQSRKIWSREAPQKSRQSRLEVTGEAPALYRRRCPRKSRRTHQDWIVWVALPHRLI